MYDETAKIAAAWWVQQVMKKYSSLPHKRNPDDSSVIIDPSLQEVLCLFEKALYDEIRNTLEKFNHIYIGCSYYPDKLLSRLAKAVQLPLNYFPIDADMEIIKNSITVSYGKLDWHKISSAR